MDDDDDATTDDAHVPTMWLRKGTEEFPSIRKELVSLFFSSSWMESNVEAAGNIALGNYRELEKLETE